MTTRVIVVPAGHPVTVEVTEHRGDDIHHSVHELSAGAPETTFHIHSGHHITVREKKSDK